MGIRESLNNKPAIAVGVAAVAVLFVVGYIVYNLFSGGAPGASSGAVTEKAFFSDDNGKTFFVDAASKYPPFDRNGKPAYQAFVFTIDGGKTKFVGYLQRYTKDAHKRIMDSIAQGGQVSIAVWEEVSFTGIEVKAPGTPDEPKNWINKSDPAHTRVTQVRAPDGSSKTPELVFPE